MIDIIKSFIPIGSSNRPGMKMNPLYITIHNTANNDVGADALMHNKYMQSTAAKQREVSWHFTVDDKRIVQNLPTDEIAWHAGDGHGDGNMKSIGIEICENKDGNFNKAMENAVWLVQKLMSEFDIPISNVVPHRHWSGKHCPHVILDSYGWDKFIGQIKTITEPPKTQKQKSPLDDVPDWVVPALKAGLKKGAFVNPKGSDDWYRFVEVLNNLGLFK